MGEGDDEGWVRVRNYKGELGYVPRSYLEVGAGPGRPGSQDCYSDSAPPALSFSSVDYTPPTLEFHPLESIPEVS